MVSYLLKETPERWEELLACLTDKDWTCWRRHFEAEIAKLIGGIESHD